MAEESNTAERLEFGQVTTFNPNWFGRHPGVTAAGLLRVGAQPQGCEFTLRPEDPAGVFGRILASREIGQHPSWDVYRDHPRAVLTAALGVVLGHLRGYPPRHDGDNKHILGGQLWGDDVGEAVKGPFGGSVRRRHHPGRSLAGL